MQKEEIKGLLKKKFDTNNKFCIKTYGCQMNEHDSEAIDFLLSDLGLIKTIDINNSNLIIVNTCAIRGTAENKALGFIGSLKKLKEVKPDLKIIVSGCLPKVEGALENFINKNKHIDILMGTSNYHSLPRLLLESFKSANTIVETTDQYNLSCTDLGYLRMYKHKSFVNITYGCDNFCSYCIVPYTRGRERSREIHQIVKEVQNLVKDGVKEVTLLGQNVNSYGKGLCNSANFAKLLDCINQIDGLKRIRFMTSHPKDISDEVINAYGNLENLSKHLHLPVQSGSDKILKLMNRKYSSDEYKSIIDKIKSIDSNIALTTDIIVGFPGETEEDFQATLDLVKYVEYDSIFIFLYSSRVGTPASNMPNQIADKIKSERFNRLASIVNEIALRKNQAYLGKNIEVLVDDVSKNNDKMLSGRTDTFKLVNFEGPTSLIGEFVNVKIDKVGTFSLDGSML